MEIKLYRKYRKSNYTIGQLFINGKYFSDCLEDPDRGLTDTMSLEEIKRIKIFGNTCIPYGLYKVTITYSPKFKRNLPLINNVKGFEGIRIHNGNSLYDTAGCILPGFNKVKGKVIDSKATTERLIKVILEAIDKGEEITIQICK